MESKESTPNFEKYKKKETERTVPMWLIALIITLSVAVAILIVLLVKNDRDDKEEREDLIETSERDQKLMQDDIEILKADLQEMSYDFDTLMGYSQSLDSQLLIKQERIKELLAINSSNYATIKKYQAELGTLREIMRSYIVQIDSLNLRNDSLTRENLRITNQWLASTEEAEKYKEKYEDASQQVAIAKRMYIRDVFVAGYIDKANREDKLKNSAKKIDKIRVDFTINKNPNADPGKKPFYVKITAPDGQVLPARPEDQPAFFQFEGNDEPFSASRVVDFNRDALEVRIYWNKTIDLSPGIYYCEIFCEDYLVGNLNLELKK